MVVNLTGPGAVLTSEITVENATGITFDDLSTAGAYSWKTENAEAVVSVAVDSGTGTVNLTVLERDNTDQAPDTFTVQAIKDASDDEIEFEGWDWATSSDTISADY